MTLKTIAANIVIIAASLPLLLVVNDNGALWYNALGLAYGYLLFRHGRKVAPRFVREYLEKLDRKAEKWDAPFE